MLEIWHMRVREQVYTQRIGHPLSFSIVLAIQRLDRKPGWLLGYLCRSFQCSVVYGECLLPMHGRPFDIESRMLVKVQKYFTTVFQPHIPFNLLTIAFGLGLSLRLGLGG